MTAPKKPQDHQESADQKPKVEKVAGGRKITFPKLTTLVDGKRTPLTVQVEDDAFNDFELLDDLRSLDVEQNASRLPSVLRRVVAEADFRTVMDALRDPKTGRVTITAGTDFVQELFGAINPNS